MASKSTCVNCGDAAHAGHYFLTHGHPHSSGTTVETLNVFAWPYWAELDVEVKVRVHRAARIGYSDCAQCIT